MLKKKSYTGLDLGSSSVKAVNMSMNKDGGYNVNSIGISYLPPGAIEEGIIKDPERVASAIQEAFTTGNIKERTVLTALPASSIITRELEMPNMPLSEMGEAIRWEAEEYLPFGLDDAMIDFVVLEEREENTDVLLVAAKKEIVESYIKPIRLAKLRPQCLNIEPLAHYAILHHNEDIEHQNLAIVDIGFTYTGITLLKGKRIELIRNLTMGGADFTQALQEAFELSPERAEDLKILVGDIEDDTTTTSEGIPYLNIKEVLTEQTRTLLEEISRSFSYFQVQQRGEVFQHIFLTGSGSQMTGLPDTLFSELAVPVQIIDPLANLKLTRSFDPALMKNVSSLSVAIGVILSEVMGK